MFNLSQGLARSHGKLLSRLLWPTCMLFVATLVMVVSTFLWTSDNANVVGAEYQRERLSAGIDAELDRIRTEFGALLRPRLRDSVPAVRDGLVDIVEQVGSDTHGFDGLAGRSGGEVRSRGQVKAGFRPALERLLETHALPPISPRRALTDRALAAATEVRLTGVGPDIYAVATIALSQTEDGAKRPAVLIAWEQLDPSLFQGIAEASGLKEFRIGAPGARRSHEIAISDVDGSPAALLSWTPDRPGDLLRERQLPLVLVGIAVAVLLFGAVALHFHRTTRNLAETDAVAKELAGRDPLSGLANRLLFTERLDAELRRLDHDDLGFALMFIDLDRFKDVNDSYGHQAGDDLIRLVAGRLRSVLRDGDTLARLGGDEFAVIQSGVRAGPEVEHMSRRILDELTRPFTLAHSQVSIGASIGVALAPDDARDHEGLMRLADTALYQAKSEGRNRTSFFQRKMDETLRIRKVVEEDLRRAIAEDGLTLHYQPIVSASGEATVGLEALVRWPHPERGMISPAEFIPIAEERGLVIPLGEWVLRKACEDGKRWPDQRIAVNVSPIQFRHRQFVETVTRVLEETGFEPSRLEIELTEGVVVEDADAAEAAMIDLRALGVNLALDDFGTGYSSLIYLRRFAFDTIKIDRSFLESMEATGESAILVHSIVHLGRALGLIVTAEGVETKEQHRFLQALGCHQLQGFLFSRPLSRDEVDRRLGISEPDVTANAA